MKRILLVILVLSVASICYAADGEEKITLTTYYPASYGEYDGLHANSMAVGSGYVIPATDGNLVVEGNVGIGTESPQGVLDLQSTTSGFIPPRMATAQRDAINPSVIGMVIYNTDSDQLEDYNGSRWLAVGQSKGCLVRTYLVNITNGVATVTPQLPTGATRIDNVTPLWEGSTWPIDDYNNNPPIPGFQGIPPFQILQFAYSNAMVTINDNRTAFTVTFYKQDGTVFTDYPSPSVVYAAINYS